jgi:hypothetical protein
LSGRVGKVTHRYITPASVIANQVVESNESEKITVGHIGSLYSITDFFKFVTLFHEFARLKNKDPEVHMWGCSMDTKKIPKDLLNSIHFYPTLPEEQVIPQLARCTFVYAMYPTSKKLWLFAKTSLPTKLGSYVQAGRPIFGHGPSDSSLAEFISTTCTGALWANTSTEQGLATFDRLLDLNPDLSQWQKAREIYFGEQNIEEIKNAISFERFAIES